MSSKKPLLFAIDVPFWRADSGSTTRTASLLRYLLKQHFQVHVYYLDKLHESEKPLIVQNFPKLVLHGGADILRVRPEASRLGDFLDETHRGRFLETVQKVQPAAIIINYLRLAYLIEPLSLTAPPRPLLAIDTHDVLHSRCANFESLGLRHWMTIDRSEEQEALRAFDLIISIQALEAKLFKELAPDKEIIVAPHGLDVENLRLNKSISTRGSEIVVSYLGIPSTINKFSLRKFIESVWEPSILAADMPQNCSLLVGGLIANEDFVRKQPPGNRIRSVGFVDCVTSFFLQSDIFVNPTHISGGLKIKNVLALGSGVALLTSPPGAEGLEEGIGSAFLVAKSTAEFKGNLCKLVTDSGYRDHLRKQARIFALRSFDWDVAFADLNCRLAGI